MYEEVTRDILIRVRPAFLEEESEPEEGRYVWAYTIEIENKGAETVQLMSREWRITDAFNQTEIVRGPGVVGEQPHIEPGEMFAYTSGAPCARPPASCAAATPCAPKAETSSRPSFPASRSIPLQHRHPALSGCEAPRERIWPHRSVRAGRHARQPVRRHVRTGDRGPA